MIFLCDPGTEIPLKIENRHARPWRNCSMHLKQAEIWRHEHVGRGRVIFYLAPGAVCATFPEGKIFKLEPRAV